MTTAAFVTAELGGSQCHNLRDHKERCRIVIIGLFPEFSGMIRSRSSDVAQEGVQPPSRQQQQPHRPQNLLRL